MCINFLVEGRENYQKTQKVVRFFSIGIIPFALCLYMFFLWNKFDAPLAFVQAQDAGWGRRLIFPGLNIFSSLLFGIKGNMPFLLFINSVCTLPFLLITYFLIRDKTMKPEYKLYYVLTLLASIITGSDGNTQSYARFMLLLFPGFIFMAKSLKNETVFMVTILVMFMTKIILTGMYGDGYWVT